MEVTWEDEILTHFASANNLGAFIAYSCKNITERQIYSSTELASVLPRNNTKTDPISHTAIIFMTSPLSLSMNEVGIRLFKKHCTILFPYSLMTQDQKECVTRCLRKRSEWVVTNNTIVFHTSATQRFIPPIDILIALCDKILTSGKAYDDKIKMGLCNIILQRVRGSIQIETPVQRQLNEWFAKRQAV